MAAKNEKIRLNEVGPGEIENPELREIINKSVRGINELQTQFERFRDGKISVVKKDWYVNNPGNHRIKTLCNNI